MSKQIKKNAEQARNHNHESTRKQLTVEELEARIAPALLAEKKGPEPYPPGSRYGLVRRDSLQY